VCCQLSDERQQLSSNGTTFQKRNCLNFEGGKRFGGWVDRQMGKWTDGLMDRWTDGQMDRWTDGQMDRWTDGQMDR
jgi:hypothetical protein